MSSSMQASTPAAVNPADPRLGGGPNDYEMAERRQDRAEDEGNNDGSAGGGGAGQGDGTADDGPANDPAPQPLMQYMDWSAQDPLWFRVYRVLFWPHIKIYFYLKPHLARLTESVSACGDFAIGLFCFITWAFLASASFLFASWTPPDREDEPSSLSESASAFSSATAASSTSL
ncbi:uncharacterized protein L3040_008227 [Drepanopeziza brunnea f. sp. 'multigermtubi']|uniref:Uncharacterized protein n=1 Tax=Marssonina brunnea f. sp. multigermtubi (strain MB_m1) TaxID=1072389 RepID=K1WNA7_MARBU|nr:uncharacterized protein MBM_07641 [Drepanopeziza brunnea f. sp. 'multigermtubi' MB_m1]EKD14411.1 hypothetical protein MBM_07641 [Drepanopeziza brunnea f. sp. 'multigermtubi' MB_m1]KAJ5034960.1 hypothetical protein L3040_008227 [Drepanopeziza brunnea f. sp. 'multigermtubi']